MYVLGTNINGSHYMLRGEALHICLTYYKLICPDNLLHQDKNPCKMYVLGTNINGSHYMLRGEALHICLPYYKLIWPDNLLHQDKNPCKMYVLGTNINGSHYMLRLYHKLSHYAGCTGVGESGILELNAWANLMHLTVRSQSKPTVYICISRQLQLNTLRVFESIKKCTLRHKWVMETGFANKYGNVQERGAP